MKRLLVGGAVLALAIGGLGTSFAGDDNHGARKTALLAATSGNADQCDSAEDASTSDVSGFVIVNAPGKPDAAQKVNGEVSLKRGLPDHDYTVWIAGSDGTCLPTGFLSTNGQGHGNSHIDMPDLTSGTYYVVIKDGPDEAFTTAPVTVR